MLIFGSWGSSHYISKILRIFSFYWGSSHFLWGSSHKFHEKILHFFSQNFWGSSHKIFFSLWEDPRGSSHNEKKKLEDFLWEENCEKIWNTPILTPQKIFDFFFSNFFFKFFFRKFFYWNKKEVNYSQGGTK